MLSFQDLYDSYAADVYRFAFWLSGDGKEAEDITSSNFIRAWVRNNTIHTETLKAYLFAIARNLYLERQRKRKREVDIEDALTDPNPGPEKQVDYRLEIQRIQEILQALPEINRTAIILRVHYELPYEEIARILGLTLSAVKVKVHRFRRKLLDEEVS
jgi:RNA polymerase sigma-70 factor (ECF subfamily)